MIFKRVAANLRGQNWSAILIEFAIVVAGVFVGTWVANLNQQRIEVSETRQMLRNLKPELRGNLALFGTVRHYYAVTRRLGTTAFAGWRGEATVSDRDFVIAAYLASQKTTPGSTGAAGPKPSAATGLALSAIRNYARISGS